MSMRTRGECGSIVSLLCDRGDRYDQTLFDADWLERNGLDPSPWAAKLAATLDGGSWHSGEAR